MWKPSLDFVTLHYAYIISLGILGLIIIYPYGNVPAVDAYFFGVSSSTESGLNTIDVKDLKTYQQLVIYFFPIIANIGFVNIIVVIVRLYWFEKKLNEVGPAILSGEHEKERSALHDDGLKTVHRAKSDLHGEQNLPENKKLEGARASLDGHHASPDDKQVPRITFAPDPRKSEDAALYIPSPREREQGVPVQLAIDGRTIEDDDEITHAPINRRVELIRRRSREIITNSTSIERIASSMFVIGPSTSSERMSKEASTSRRSTDNASIRTMPARKLTAKERKKLGGIEYTSLRLLLKLVLAYFFGLHIFGAICLIIWIQFADQRYLDTLAQSAINRNWWALYSAQTMVNNLGFTLTPDSMVSFRDAHFPMLLMTFLAYAGNTFYPCFLRLFIYLLTLPLPSDSPLRTELGYLLHHPRRCYTLLFPRRTTWILFGILFAMNLIDTILIITLDLDNPSVNVLPMGTRILAATFQSASARHTGTSTFNLADVHPGVQFSLVVMMYISVFPIAISVRASNTYEDRAVGLYKSNEEDVGEPGRREEDRNVGKYLVKHAQNQLSFDLWYIFLGAFCICLGESKRIMDIKDPAFSIFSIIFEVVSAYANVGLSLGHPTVMTSLCGQFTIFSKLVICAMMIRGRHRGLPYKLDSAILLPSERDVEDRAVEGGIELQEEKLGRGRIGVRMRKAVTC